MTFSDFSFDTNNLPTAEGLREFQQRQNERLAAIAERGRQARSELAATEFVERSADGAVTVTVGAGGVMRDISFGPKAAGLPPTQLRASIMKAYQAGCRKSAERSSEILRRIADVDTPAGQMLRDAVPTFEDEDDAPTGARR